MNVEIAVVGERSGASVREIEIPAGWSSLETAIVLVELLVEQHGAVVTDAGVWADGTGTVTLTCSLPAD